MSAFILSAQEARRIAIAAQRLEAPSPNPAKADILDTIRQITCLQIDPINVVARTQLLVLFSRLGRYNPADLDALLWDDKALFEYWAHAASIVLADDFPIFQVQMAEREPATSAWGQRVERWWSANESFRRYILDEMSIRGPVFADEIEDRAVVGWDSTGWTGGRNVSTMLDMMWSRGHVTVTRRVGDGYGLKKQWGLLEHQLPGRAGTPPLQKDVVVRQAVERALLALGPARPRDIKQYFTRGAYPGLERALADLVRDGRILLVSVAGDDGPWPGPWYLHASFLEELERLPRGGFRPQTVLLSPFDNLIADRDRTELLFNFYYRIEIYTPAAKRRYGYYVMPILHGDRLIGRVDPRMDRKARRLTVNAVHLEPGVAAGAETRAAVEGAVERLAAFLGADSVNYPAAMNSR